MALTLAVKVTADASVLKAEVQSAGQAITELGTKARSSGQALGDAATAEAAAMAEMRSAVTGAGTAAELSGRAAQDMADQALAAARATSDQAAAIQALKDKVDPLAAKQREAAASVELWKSWADQGRISQQELAVATGRLESEIGRMQAAAAGAARNSPWWMNSNITRNWIDVVQQLAMTGGQIQYALPSIIDAADVTNYYREQAERAGKASATMAGSITASGAGAAEAADGLADAAAGTVLVGGAAAGAATKATAAGTAFAGLTGTAVVVGGAVVVLAGVVIAGTAAWYSHTEAIEQVQRAHQVVGGYMALTGDEMEAMAASAANAGAISVAAARDMQTAFLSTRSVGAETMETLIGLSRDWAEVTGGGDVADAGADLARVFSDPKAAVEQLDKSFNLLTATEKTQITTLIEHGRKTEAQAILADKLKERIQGLHAEAVNPLTAAFETLGRVAANAWNSLGAAITRAVSGASDGAKLATAESELAALKRNLDDAKKNKEAFGLLGTVIVGDPEKVQQQVNAKEQEVALLRAQVGLTKQLADERAAADQGKLDGKAAAETLKSYDVLGQRQKQIAAEVARISAGAAADPAIADAAGRTLSRLGQEYADLAEITASGLSVEEWKGQKRAIDETTAATMADRKAAKVWLAEQEARRAMIGTTTDATDRDTAAQTARTSALAQQTATLTAAMVANDAELKGANAIADAYAASTAEGLRAEAMAQALAEAQSSGAGAAWAAAEANRQLAVDVARARAETEQLIDRVQADTADSTALTRAILGGADTEMAETIRQQVAEATQAQAERIAALTDETLKQAELVKLEGERKALTEAMTEGAIAERRQQFALELRDLQSSLSLQQAELAVAGLTGAERTKALALIQAENDLKQYGNSLTEAERQQYIDTAVAIAAANAELEQANALKGAYDDAARSLSDGLTEALKTGLDDLDDFADQVRDIFTDLHWDIADQLVFTPVIQAVIGYSYSSTASALGITSVADATSSTGQTTTGTGATSWSSGGLSNFLTGSNSSFSDWLKTDLFSLDSGSSTASSLSYSGADLSTASGDTYTFVDYGPVEGAGDYGSLGSTTSTTSATDWGVTGGEALSAGLSAVSAVLDFSNGNYISGVANTIATVLAFTPLSWLAPIVSIAGTLLESLFGDMFADQDYPLISASALYDQDTGDFTGEAWLTLDTEDDGSAEELATSTTTALNELLALTGAELADSFDSFIGIGFASDNPDSTLGEGWYYSTDMAGLETEQVVTGLDSAEEALLGLAQAIFDGYVDPETISDNVALAIANTDATTLDDYASDLSFGYNFDYMVQELTDSNLNLEDSIEAAVASSMETTLDTIQDFTATTEDLGLDTQAAYDATQTYVMQMVGIEDAPDELTDVQQAWLELEAMFADSNLTPILAEVGLAGYDAAQLLADAEAEIRSDYVDSLTANLNELNDQSWLNDAADIRDWYEAELTNIATIGGGSAEALEVLNAYLTDLIDEAGGGAAAVDALVAAVPELTDQLDALRETALVDYTDSLTASLYDLQDRGWLNDVADLWDWYEDALTRVGDSADAAAAVNDVLAESLYEIYAASGVSAEAIAELTAAAPQLGEAIAGTVDDFIAANADLKAASVDLVTRGYAVSGDDLSSSLLSFDDQAALERVDYAALGGNLYYYDAVVAAERARIVYDDAAGALSDVADETQSLADDLDSLADTMAGLSDTAAGLRWDDALSTLSALEQLTEIRAEYDAAYAAALDDGLSAADREQAVADFDALAQTRAEAERSYWGDALEYDEAFSDIQADLLSVAEDEAAAVRAEGDALQATLDDVNAAIEAASGAEVASLEDLQATLESAAADLSAKLAVVAGLLGGTDTTAITDLFFMSESAAQEIVQAVYSGVIGRDAATAEIDRFAPMLVSGEITEAGLYDKAYHSEEYATNLIAEVYDTVIGRAATDYDWDKWLGQIMGGTIDAAGLYEKAYAWVARYGVGAYRDGGIVAALAGGGGVGRGAIDTGTWAMTGGPVANGLYDQDSVLARYGSGEWIELAGGEFVVTARSVNDNTAWALDYINETGELPWDDDDGTVVGGFAAGGVVGAARLFSVEEAGSAFGGPVDDDALAVPPYVHVRSWGDEDQSSSPAPAPTAGEPQGGGAAVVAAIEQQTAALQQQTALVAQLLAEMARLTAENQALRRDMTVVARTVTKRAS